MPPFPPPAQATNKFADIVAVPGDVLQDIRATERPLLVMKQGVVVRGNPGERDAE